MQEDAAGRFLTVDVFLDSAARPLAAWQVEVADEAGAATIVGVEGGEHAAFREPAYYDPRALQGGRIILAAFSTAKDLPSGRTRVATLHFRVEANRTPDLTVKVMAAATGDGTEIEVLATIEQGERK